MGQPARGPRQVWARGTFLGMTQGQAEWVTHLGPSLVSAASGQPPLWSQGGCGGELTGPGLSVSQPIWTGCPA